MATIGVAILPIALVLMLAQAVTCLRPSEPAHVRWLGVLSGIVLALAAVVYGLLASGTLVLSPELGVVMTQGIAGWWCLAFVVAAAPAAVALGTYLVRSREPAGKWVGVLVSGGLVVGLIVAAKGISTDESSHVHEFFWYPPRAVWICFWLLMGVWCAYHVRSPKTWVSGLRSFVAALALLTIAMGVVDPFYLLETNPRASFGLCMLGWLVLVEAASTSLTRTLSQAVGAAPGTVPPEAVGVVGAPPNSSQGWLRTWLGAISVGHIVTKAVVGMVAVVFLADWPNANKTIVEPFRSPAGDAYRDLGPEVSDRLVNELGSLRQELRPDMGGLLHHGASATAFGGIGGSSAENTLGGTQEIELPYLKVPLRVFVAPIEAPIRRLLHIRMIEGAVEVEDNRVGDDLMQVVKQDVDHETHRASKSGEEQLRNKLRECQSKYFTVLASSSDGETWSAVKTECAPTDPAKPYRSRFELVRGLAFNILRKDPALKSGHFTDSYEAFQRFEEGLDHWKRQVALGEEFDKAEWKNCETTFADGATAAPAAAGEAAGNRSKRRQKPEIERAACLEKEDLIAAIYSFENALLIDPAFGLAHYRLGTALRLAWGRDHTQQHYAQSAESHLRQSLKYNPELTAASLELAALLFDRQNGKGQARELYQQVTLSNAAPPLDRAAAASKLCREELLPLRPNVRYFYCKQGESIFARLAAQDDTPALHQQLATVYNGIGNSLAQRTSRESHDGFLPAALRYYDRALALAPEDDEARAHAQQALPEASGALLADVASQ